MALANPTPVQSWNSQHHRSQHLTLSTIKAIDGKAQPRINPKLCQEFMLMLVRAHIQLHSTVRPNFKEWDSP